MPSMTAGAQALTAVADSAEPPYRDSARCLLRLERDGIARLLSASPPFAILYDKRPDEIVGRSAAALFGICDEALAELMRACLGRMDAIETDLSLPVHGTRHQVRLILVPQPGDGEVLVLFIDLPDTLDAPEKPAAGYAAGDLLVRYTPELQVLGCSTSYAALHGRKPEEMTGRNLADWLPPDELENVRQAVAGPADNEIVNTNQILRTLPDGSRRWYRWVDVVLPVPDGRGGGVRTEILSIGMDITKLKRAKARLRDAIESINEGFCLFDKQGRLVMFNEQFRAMYPKSAPAIYHGVTMTEMLRYSAATGELGPIEDPAQFAEQVRRQMELNPELRYQRRLTDGRWILISQRRTSDGGYVGLRTDITSVKKNEAALQRATDELERKNAALVTLTQELREARIAADESNRAKSRFLAHMSHELRTPLNSVIGFADIMRAGLFGPVEPQRYRDYVELIHNSGELLLSLINDVLDMSKIEAGKMELSIQPLQTAALAESCRSLVIGMARDSSVALKIEVDADCPEIHADERAAKQMIINLMSNAVKFTPAGGVVTLHFRNLGEHGVAVSIADNGIGMTPAELEKAMLPFGQVDSELARQHKGTGIGLTLVKSLVELHGGTLDLTSEKGRGTTATITLPWMKPAG
jgi:two-component system cell cycle sensor histidine kinase PleC